MKKLNLFQQFNFGAWAKDRQFMIQSIKWNDKKGCVSLDVIITEDNTNYRRGIIQGTRHNNKREQHDSYC